MHLRHRRTVAALAALSVTTPALLALASSPASAGTSSGAPSPAPTLTGVHPALRMHRFSPVGYTASDRRRRPSRQVRRGLGDRCLHRHSVTGAVVAGGLKDSPLAATEVGFGRRQVLALTATNTTGALTSPNLGPKPSVPITGYVADPDGAGPLTSTANDGIAFHFPRGDLQRCHHRGGRRSVRDRLAVVEPVHQRTGSAPGDRAASASTSAGAGTPGMGGFIE